MTGLEEVFAEMKLEEEEIQETERCRIDPETREIIVPDAIQLLGVESDEKVERVLFQCPKMVGDHIDLSELILFINYENANGEFGVYCIDDVELSEGNILFSWLLSRKVTKYKGNVKFILCAKKAVDDGTLKNEWNTTVNRQCKVLEGLEGELPEPDPEEESVLLGLIGQATDAITRTNNASKKAEDITREIQGKIESGELTGPQGPPGPQGETGPPGPQGPKGEDGVASVTQLNPGMFGMYVNEEGHLIMTHNDNEPAPPLSIRDGKLIYTIS